MRLLWLFIGLTLTISVIILTFGYFVYPLPGYDAVYFVPPAIQFAAGHGLTNPLFSLDQSGYARWVQYPPLFPLAMGLFMPTATARCAFVTLSAMNCISLFLFTLLVNRSSRRSISSNGTRTRMTLLTLATVVAASTHFVGNDGRPETLATLIVLAAAVVVLWRRGNPLALGILLGLLGATHPVAALLTATLLGMYFAATCSCSAAWRALAVTCGVSALAFTAVLLVSPLPIADVLSGVALHTQSGAFGPPGVPIFDIFHRRATEWTLLPHEVLLVFTGINILYRITCKSVGRIRNHILVYGFCGVLCVLCLFFVFRYTNRDYNLFPFLPLCYLLILYGVQAAESNLQDKKTRQLAWAAAFAVVLFSAVPLWRSLVLFPMFLRKGVGLAEARREFQGRIGHGSPVGVSVSMWVLSERYDSMYLPENSHNEVKRLLDHGPMERRAGISSSVFVEQQNYFPALRAPSLSGCTLLWNNFRAEPARYWRDQAC